jgi:hypothetical protein
MHAYDLNLCTDLHCSRRTLTLAAPRSCAATSSTNAPMGIGCHQPVRLPRANPHSARGTSACYFPRFRSLKAFGRRPRCTPRRRDRPASETLNIFDRFSRFRLPVHVCFAPKADPRTRVEVGREPVIQASKLGSFDSWAMNLPTTNGLPSSRCCRTSRRPGSRILLPRRLIIGSKRAPSSPLRPPGPNPESFP